MMKYTIAVLALLYGANAIKFAGDIDDEDAMTLASIKEAEKVHGTKLPDLSKEIIAETLAENNNIHFNGDSLQKVTLQPFETHKAYPGVTFVQIASDPIYGGLGAPAVAMEDLTHEQQFEEGLRRMRKTVLKDERESTIETRDSIAQAERLTGTKMPNPSDDSEKERLERGPEYHLHTKDEEDEDTKETRRSVKVVEKRDKHRFWINAREERDYRKDVAAGKIDSKQLTFQEGKDEDVGQVDKADEEAQKDKAAAAKKKEDEAAAGKDLTPEQAKELKKREEEEEADAKAKAETPEEKEAEEKAVEKKAEAKKEAKKAEAAPAPAGDLPPELAGAAIQIAMEQYGVVPDYSNILA